MNDTYFLKIEVDLPVQMKLIDSILDVEHDGEENGAWILSMDYDEVFGDLPIYYISNFVGLLKGKYGELEKIGIKRDKISVWRCVYGAGEVFMEYWPEEMEMLAKEGLHFRIMVCQEENEPFNPFLPHFDC